MAPLINAPAPNVPYYVPRQYPPAGTAFDPQPDGKPLPSLFQPIKIRGVEFQNRIWVRTSPVCPHAHIFSGGVSCLRLELHHE